MMVKKAKAKAEAKEFNRQCAIGKLGFQGFSNMELGITLNLCNRSKVRNSDFVDLTVLLFHF